MPELTTKRVITIETWERTVIRDRPAKTTWCANCRTEVVSPTGQTPVADLALDSDVSQFIEEQDGEI